MIKRLTKKHILEGMKIAHNKGYWSDQVREYTSMFDFGARQKLDTILQSLYNSAQYKASSHYQLALENNLI